MTSGQGSARLSAWIMPDEGASDADPGRAAIRRREGTSGSATNLQRLYADLGQSPWLDNLTRRYLRDGTLARMVAAGVRGVTANPTIFADAIEGSADYDEQFAWLISTGRSVEEAYWELVATDVVAACDVLRPVYEEADRSDGFVSVEVAPELADDTAATIAAARRLHDRVGQPNVLVKVPATAAGVPAVEALTAEGRSVNVTLIFSLRRYAQIVDAYLSGLEAFAADGGDLSTVHGVASFFVSRVDTEVDRRLGARPGLRALELRGRAAISQAKLAYRLFNERFSGERWQSLAGQGANRQLPLWASMSVKNPAARDTRYVEQLSGPNTVCTLPEATIEAFEDHGMLIPTIDIGVREAVDVMRGLADVGIDMDDVALALESEGVEAFRRSFRRVMEVLDAKKPRVVA